MYNKITLIGNTGKDAETKRLDSGQTVATFSLATQKKWKDKSGGWQEKNQWHNIVIWGDLAERADNLKKGMQLFIEGEVEYREYTTASGEKKERTEIVASTVRILGKKESSGSTTEQPAAPSPAATRPAPVQSQPAQAPPPAKPEYSTDDLPF
jgi:single-strand DNA-binding protein